MQVRKTNVRNSVNSGFLNFIERYWFVLLGLIISIPIVMRYVKDAETKGQENKTEEEIKLIVNANQTPLTQLSGMNKITTNSAYHTWALTLAADLGTLYTSRSSSWNFIDQIRGATENDKKVYDSLKQVQNSGQKRILNDLYFFLVQRNLNEDVVKLLDPPLLAKLPLFN